MLTWIRSHLGVAAAAVVVLVVALSSSATAALVITSKNIKNNTVQGKDVKDGTLTSADLSATVNQAIAAQPPGFVGSACALPNSTAGTISLQVAANGTVTLICSVPSAPAQNGDTDSDGYLKSQECNDSNAAIHPGATEVNANLVDDDCDGHADDGLSAVDTDGDGDSIQQGDCDDTNPAAHPGATDGFGNGRDEDCDGVDG